MQIRAEVGGSNFGAICKNGILNRSVSVATAPNKAYNDFHKSHEDGYRKMNRFSRKIKSVAGLLAAATMFGVLGLVPRTSVAKTLLRAESNITSESRFTREVEEPGEPTATPVPGELTATPTPAESEPTATPTPDAPIATPAPGEPTATPTPVENEPTATPVPDEPTPTPGEGEPTGEPTATPTPTPTPTPGEGEKETGFEGFVERLYNIALNRESDPEGKAFWVKRVKEEGATGADCAVSMLIDPPEFKDRGLTDEEYVKVLYATFFDREGDEEGYAFWVRFLNEKGLKDTILGFIDSTEWCNICASFSIKSGAPNHKATTPSANARAFAERMYTKCLGRDAEEYGAAFWALALTNLEYNAAEVANNFFFSTEFRSHEFSDEEYLDRLYATVMDREAEEGGKEFWLQYIREHTRYQILCEFVESPEFTGLCQSYGIDRGSLDRSNDPDLPAPTPEPTPEPTPVPTPTNTPVPGAPYDLTGMVIVLDPGHQRHANNDLEPVAPWSDEMKPKVSAGTKGVATNRMEYEVVLEIGLQMRDLLESYGATVIMTRTSHDVNISNIERAMIAVNNHADVFLRLHCDASDSSSARGIGVFVCSRGELADKQVGWGNMLGRAMSAATGSNYRGCNASTVYSGLNWATSVPSFLLEMGFMSNAEDDRLLSDPDYQKKICNGAADFCYQMKIDRQG